MNLRFFTFFLIPLILSSCEPGKEGRRLPRHSGESGEVLVVMSENLWMGPPGDSLRAVFESYIPNLPQAEPRFSLLQFTPPQLSNMLNQHRNIVQINIGAEVADNQGVNLTRDKWSNHQLVYTANSADLQTFYLQLRNEFSAIAKQIDITEIERLKANYQRNFNEQISQTISEKFGISIRMPLDAEIAKSADDFLWIKRERLKYLGNEAHEIVQGFFIYKYPYTSDSAFTQAEILARHDSVLQKHVPGPQPNTYMTTEYRYPPVSQAEMINDKYVFVTRGLWRTENYFMGGPFITYTTTNKNGGEIITISGFVFAPKFDKREYIREVEALLRTLTVSTK